jgi:hypothetical protein
MTAANRSRGDEIDPPGTFLYNELDQEIIVLWGGVSDPMAMNLGKASGKRT